MSLLRRPRSAAALILLLLIALPATAAGRTAARRPGQARAPSARAAADPYASAPTRGALYRDGQDRRYLLGGTWLLRADPGDQGVAGAWWQPGTSTDGWSPISVPNSANAGDFSPSSMNGSVYWYRRDFVLPAGAFAAYVPRSAQRWVVRFESVNYRATVWLNGHRLGSHTGAYVPFEFALSALQPGVNQLVVRVDDRRSSGDLPPGPGGGWWNFAGLQREVYLRAVSAVDISRVQVRPLLPCPTCAAAVDERALLRNLTASPQTVTLRGRFGRLPLALGTHTIPPGGTWSAHDVIALPRPHLWAPDDPYLYRARLAVYDQRRRALGGFTTWSGVRSVAVTPDGRIVLNGRLLDLRGVNIHEQDVGEGAALDVAHLRRLFGWAQTLGAGIIRAHYPLNPELEELADRSGILLWSEVPVYQLSGSALSNPAVIAQAHRILTENILANQDHPSVLVWSIGNELPTPAPASEARYIAGAAALAKRLDPTRPVSMAVSSWPGVACQAAYRPLDVIGFNDYFGWYDAGGGSTDDRDQLGPFLDAFRQCYPSQAIMVTEFGFEANRHGPADERGTYEFQRDALTYHMQVFAARRWLSGVIYFAMQDFAVHPGWAGGDPEPNPPFVQKGVVDQYGNEKPNFGLLGQLIRATVQLAPAPAAARPSTAAARPRRQREG